MKLSIAFTLMSTVSGFSWIFAANDSKNGICNSKELSFVQRRICRRNKKYEDAVSAAARASLSASELVLPEPIGENVRFQTSKMKEASAEAAYLHGLSSAQLSIWLFKLCRSGVVGECNERKVEIFAKEFTNVVALSKRRKSVTQLDLHNSKVGRFVATESQRQVCKCHGASGSCSVKTCWATVPLSEHVADKTKQKYENSIGIEVTHKSSSIPRRITDSIAKNHFLYIQN